MSTKAAMGVNSRVESAVGVASQRELSRQHKRTFSAERGQRVSCWRCLRQASTVASAQAPEAASRIHVPPLPLTPCEALGKLLNLSVPDFSLKWDNDSTYLTGSTQVNIDKALTVLAHKCLLNRPFPVGKTV